MTIRPLSKPRDLSRNPAPVLPSRPLRQRRVPWPFPQVDEFTRSTCMTTTYPQRQTQQRDEAIRQACAERRIEILNHGNSLRLVGRDIDFVVRSLADVHLSDLEPFVQRRR